MRDYLFKYWNKSGREFISHLNTYVSIPKIKNLPNLVLKPGDI